MPKLPPPPPHHCVWVCGRLGLFFVWGCTPPSPSLPPTLPPLPPLPFTSLVLVLFRSSAIKWTTNPYLWSTNTPALVASVLSVSVAGVNVTNATTPLVVSMPVSSTTPLSQFQCSHWSEAIGNWSQRGSVLVGFETEADGSITALCATLHLTDFSAVKKQTSACRRGRTVGGGGGNVCLAASHQPPGLFMLWLRSRYTPPS
jgi:hypothetical protein